MQLRQHSCFPSGQSCLMHMHITDSHLEFQPSCQACESKGGTARIPGAGAAPARGRTPACCTGTAAKFMTGWCHRAPAIRAPAIRAPLTCLTFSVAARCAFGPRTDPAEISRSQPLGRCFTFLGAGRRPSGSAPGQARLVGWMPYPQTLQPAGKGGGAGNTFTLTGALADPGLS